MTVTVTRDVHVIEVKYHEFLDIEYDSDLG